MIVLDTNTVSEAIKPRADERVLRWLDEQAVESLYLTSISLAELLSGVAFLPDGKRKTSLDSGLREIIEHLFSQRILPFDSIAAVHYASILSRARKAGASISVADCQIASIAQAHGFLVATRDVEPFRAAGLRVINPWE